MADGKCDHPEIPCNTRKLRLLFRDRAALKILSTKAQPRRVSLRRKQGVNKKITRALHQRHSDITYCKSDESQ